MAFAPSSGVAWWHPVLALVPDPAERAVATHSIQHVSTGISLGQATNVAQIVIAFVALIGIFPALVRLNRQRDKERRERLAEAYSVMGDRWSDFLELCLAHPDLGLTALGISDGGELPPRKLYLYSALIQLINRAYVLYRDEPNDVRLDRYTGWERYLDDLLTFDEFRVAWKHVGFGYDESFFQYVNERRHAAGASSIPSRKPSHPHSVARGKVWLRRLRTPLPDEQPDTSDRNN